MITYSGESEIIGSEKLFDHYIWNNITEQSFGIIATHDKDNSLTNYDIMNYDIAYIIIKLPEDLNMRQDDKIILKILPEYGMDKTITLEAPMPITKVVNL